MTSFNSVKRCVHYRTTGTESFILISSPYIPPWDVRGLSIPTQKLLFNCNIPQMLKTRDSSRFEYAPVHERACTEIAGKQITLKIYFEEITIFNSVQFSAQVQY